MHIMVGLLIVLSLLGTLAHAEDVILTWEPPVDGTAPHGYRVHSGPATGTYTTRTDVGMTLRHVIQGLAPGTVTYFAVTAYHGATEGGYSNEVSLVLPAEGRPGPPQQLSATVTMQAPATAQMTITKKRKGKP